MKGFPKIMDPLVAAIIGFLGAVVGGFGSYFGARYTKTVDHRIAREKIDFDYKQKRIEYKMQVFGEYIALMQQFSDVTDERWDNYDGSAEWKLRLKQVVARLDKSPAMLFLSDEDTQALDDFNSRVSKLARAYFEKLDHNSDHFQKAMSVAEKKVRDQGLDPGASESRELLVDELSNFMWPDFERIQTEAELAEIFVKDILRQNLQADLNADIQGN